MSVTLTIDGRQTTVPDGTLLVEAARQIGIEIPVFCYHSKMEPVGMCRMCLVTVGTPEKDRDTGKPKVDEAGNPVIGWLPKPQTACTVVVSEGMVAITDTEEVAADRKAVLEFLLTSHPLDCPVCDKGGECPLQDLTFRHGPGVSRFIYADKHHGLKHYPLGNLIILDQERCIMCARCTRFQDELADDPVLAVENRGRDAMIVSYSDPPFDSHYSGITTDICPVGALTSRDYRFHLRPWEMQAVPSLCNLCSVGCNTILNVARNKIQRIMPRQNEAVNEIWICDKGRFAHHFHESQDRLMTPLVRRDGQLVEASWDEALDYVAQRLKAIKEDAGAKAIGGIAGAHLPNEDLYLFQKLIRQAIGSPNVDHRVGLNAAMDDDTAQVAGVGVGTDLGRLGADTSILVLGCDLDEEAPVLYLRVAGAARHGTTLINAGGRPTKLDRVAGQTLRCHYGSLAHLVLGMLHVFLFEEMEDGRRLTGNEMLARLDGLDALREKVQPWTPERAASVTGLTAGAIRQAAQAFGQAKNGIILYGMEAGADPALTAAMQNLVLVAGFAGRPNNGLLAVLPHANSRGAADLGLVPHRLPGYVPAPEQGLNAEQMLAGQVKALLIAGADPLATRPRAKEIELLVVQELLPTATTQQADVVLPAAALAERDGTFTNGERWVQHFSPTLPVVGQTRPDWVIIRHLGALLGTDWPYASTAGVLAEMAETIPLYRGMNYERLTRPIPLSRRMSHYIYAGMSFQAEAHEGLQWPTVAEQKDQKLPLTWVDPGEPDTADGLTLVAPRVLYDGGTLLHQNPLLDRQFVSPSVRLSPADAGRLAVEAGQQVELSRNGHNVQLGVEIDDSLPEGVVAVARNLPGWPAEALLGEQKVFGPVTITSIADE